MPTPEDFRQAAESIWGIDGWLHKATRPTEALRDKLYAALVPQQLQLNRLLQPLGIAATLSRFEGVEPLVTQALDSQLVSALCHVLTVLTQPAFIDTWWVVGPTVNAEWASTTRILSCFCPGTLSGCAEIGPATDLCKQQEP